MRKVIGIACSDIHLSLNSPSCYPKEVDWLNIMRESLAFLKETAEKHDVPIYFTGDLFDTWKSVPELINFAIANIPFMFSIPGQHDLPLHNYKDIRKSSYKTLALAGVIKTISRKKTTILNVHDQKIALHAFPFGFQITPLKKREKDTIHIALLHSYIWRKDHKFQKATNSTNIGKYKEKIKGYDFAIFGDNHKGFHHYQDNTQIINCGGFIRRRIDEIDYKPRIWILYNDKSVEKIYMKNRQEITEQIKRKNIADADYNIKDFVDSMNDLEESSTDYKAICSEYMESHSTPKNVRKIVMASMEGKA